MARVSNKGGLTGFWSALLHRLKMPYIVVINYHNVQRQFLETFELHLRHYADNFENFNLNQLNGFFKNTLKIERPGIIICFDDGFKDNYEAAAGLLDKYGLTGWFFIIAGKAGSTEEFAGDTKLFMSWDDMKDLLNRGHVIGCHTLTHKNLGNLTGEDLVREVVESKCLMEENIGRSIPVFCFPFGDCASYSAESIKLAREHYEYIFNSCPQIITRKDSKFSIGRNNIECYYDLGTVKFLISGLFNMKYVRRKSRFKSLLGEG